MPKVLETSLIAKFDNFADYELYLQNFYSMSVYNGRYTKCEICKTSDHKMRVQYHKCTNPSCYESSLCLKRYVTHICLKSEVEKYRKRQLLEIAGEKHNSDTFDVKKQRGLTEKVKELIEELINEYECKPKKIHIKLASSKYFNEVDVMPELEQIQSYIRYRRKLIGDNNDLDHLSEYIESLRFEEGKTNEFELIIFGDEMGNGSDQSHFHLGFTTAKLLLRIKCLSDGCYHIDATYKIVKYSYPLIVFGFSDRSRKFYPIAFMFTSHEEVRDYEHFFDSFLNTIKNCTCDRYLDKAACKHLTAACIQEDVALNGLKTKRNILLNKRRKKLIIDSDDEDLNAIEDVQNIAAINEIETVPVLETIPTIQTQNTEENDALKPKRGRPTLAEQALRKEKGLVPEKKSKKSTKQYPKTDRQTRSQKN